MTVIKLRRALILSVSLLMASALPFPSEAGKTLRGRVDHVTDGDTLRLGSVKIRLWGIDAPEGHQECDGSDGRPYPCGERAKQALEAMALGREAACEVVDTDRYGRSVAHCTVADTDVNERMVLTGNAVEYRRYSNGAFTAAERRAKAAKAGIWSGRFTMPEEWRREHRAER